MLSLNQIIFLIFTLGPTNLDDTLSSKAVKMWVFQTAPEWLVPESIELYSWNFVYYKKLWQKDRVCWRIHQTLRQWKNASKYSDELSVNEPGTCRLNFFWSVHSFFKLWGKVLGKMRKKRFAKPQMFDRKLEKRGQHKKKNFLPHSFSPGTNNHRVSNFPQGSRKLDVLKPL